MKKSLIQMISLLLVVCLLFLSGCEKATEEPAKTPEEFWARTHEWNSEQLMYSNANEYGYYYMNGESNLTYFDYATKKALLYVTRLAVSMMIYTARHIYREAHSCFSVGRKCT